MVSYKEKEVNEDNEVKQNMTSDIESDIDNIQKKIQKYDEKRKEYESSVYKYYKERRDREKTQFGWGQAINIVPLFSNAYNYSTSSINKNIDDKEIDTLNILKKSVDDEYKELMELCYKIKTRK